MKARNSGRPLVATPGRRALSFALVLALGIAGLAAPASAQLSPADYARLQRETPSCNANPNAPWVGRVSGSYQDILDTIWPFSMVGCFNDLRTCERWRDWMSGYIYGPIIEYSCRRR